MEYQWYPGHMSKAKREIQDSVKLVDVIIELLDARIPYSSKNPDIDGFAGNKPRVILLNKADLADDRITESFKAFYESKGFYVTITNAKGGNIRNVIDKVREACKEKIERDKKRGMINRPIRAMIVGIPNVGKSTFINSYAKKACTKTGDKPGVTTGKQWIRLSKDLELLDTPGILWPKFEDQKVGLNIALIGSINDNLLDKTEMAFELIKYLKANYPELLKDRFSVDTSKEPLEILNDIAVIRNCKKKGDEPDIEKMSIMLINEFKSGKIGKISLERVK